MPGESIACFALTTWLNKNNRRTTTMTNKKPGKLETTLRDKLVEEGINKEFIDNNMTFDMGEDEVKKKPVATRKKKAGKYLDKKMHKLVEGKKAACGKPIGEMSAGIWSGGVEGRDTWHFVDCKQCLALMPEVIHAVNFKPAGLYGAMEVHDDRSGARWSAETKCGSGKKTPLETTTDDTASVNCMDCLSVVVPAFRRHFQGAGSNKTTLCGAKTNSANEYSTDCWWLCTCPDCYRINKAPSVHPWQEQDVLLLLNNSIIAARNQDIKPSQNSCSLCHKLTDGTKTACLACAVLLRRDRVGANGDIEEKLSEILALPYEWTMDLLKGWDVDKSPELTYPTAYKLGKKLWRKHGQA
jgi:hypothetical protein